ncbi:MAG TPA: glycosyltransferase family A protein [Acidimicrobiales bacterium]|nr:glycosyltransferase family A protein [Acidimicrobiales bacterium]
MANRPAISVVLPTYNRCDVVEQTLLHLLAQDYPSEQLEILVCDNSSDGTPAMVERVAADAEATVRLVSSDERLPAVKRNQGLHLADGELVLFMNDDVWLRPDALAVHADAHAEHRGPVAVLGHVEQSAQMPRTAFIEWYQPFAYDLIADSHGRAVPYRFFWSMNLSLPREVMLDRQLVFHEDWANIGHEDVELGYRWSRAGYPIVYRADAWGEHYHPHDLDSACRLQYSVGRGLRDLKALVPDDDLLERYGVFSLSNSRRSIARGLARKTLFNRWTVPPLQRRFATLDRHSRIAEWSYWKILLHHTDRGYLEQGPRRPLPVETLPAPAEEQAA